MDSVKSMVHIIYVPSIILKATSCLLTCCRILSKLRNADLSGSRSQIGAPVRGANDQQEGDPSHEL